jgi:aspartate/methionine/tyrosine aminotransferase
MLQKAEGIQDIVSFALGEPDFDTPDHIKDAAVKALKEGFTKYTSNWGIPELRNAIAKKLKTENNLSVDPRTEVFVTAGAQEALYLVFQAFINPGEEVIVTDPCYHSYPRMIELAGGKPIYIALSERENFRLHIDELERRISEKTKIILLNSPQNPTGSVLELNDLKKLAGLAERRNLLVVTDEVYEKLLYDATHVSIASLPGMLDRTITINGFSKTYAMTGWRIGYCVGRKSLLDEMVKTHSYSVTSANSIAQKAAVAALEGSQKCVTDMVSEFTKRRDYVVRRMKEIDGVYCPLPLGAFYVFPNFSEFRKRSFELAEYLLTEAKIITVPGVEYGPSNDFHLRLSFATSMKNLETGLNRLEVALDELRNKS